MLIPESNPDYIGGGQVLTLLRQLTYTLREQKKKRRQKFSFYGLFS